MVLEEKLFLFPNSVMCVRACAAVEVYQEGRESGRVEPGGLLMSRGVHSERDGITTGGFFAAGLKGMEVSNMNFRTHVTIFPQQEDAQRETERARLVSTTMMNAHNSQIPRPYHCGICTKTKKELPNLTSTSHTLSSTSRMSLLRTGKEVLRVVDGRTILVRQFHWEIGDAYQCRYCHREFTHQAWLETHVDREHPEKPTLWLLGYVDQVEVYRQMYSDTHRDTSEFQGRDNRHPEPSSSSSHNRDLTTPSWFNNTFDGATYHDEQKSSSHSRSSDPP
ncbi:hypothetical protein B0J14DRAFT_565770 [Halenospora varia]|nr:hypothetical protein B0J14DRAFT_565770 [Halenospora varia]